MSGQTNYSLGPTPGLPGQIFDLSALKSGDIDSAVSASIIPFGVLCEMVLATGAIQPIQDTHANWPPSTNTTTRLYGISVYDPMGAEQGYPTIGSSSSSTGYPSGVRVPFLKRGRIWMAFDNGGTLVKGGAFNVWHSSTGANPQGVATFSAPATTAGAEIDVAPVSMEVDDPNGLSGNFTDGFGTTQAVLLVNINLPGSGS